MNYIVTTADTRAQTDKQVINIKCAQINIYHLVLAWLSQLACIYNYYYHLLLKSILT